MSYQKPAQAVGRRTRSAILAVLVVAAATFVWGHSPAGSSAAGPIGPEPSAQRAYHRPHGDRPGRPPGDGHAAPSLADGEVPDGATVLDDRYPAVANLDPDLLGALRRAAGDAAGDDVELDLNSGWRSAEYQAQLLREAVSEYGSEAEAARWVATPETSPHVSGDAVDIGSDAAAWLSDHGAAYGLCQIYRNEPWHFELRPDAVEEGCPPPYADPTHDPRLS
jgi:zinc D-Ala-D-Ala carboxypeptidase